jgi:hypothetical protein
MGRRPTQGDEKRLSATTVAGSAALPFVISTGAQRSGEICGSGPFLEMFFDRAKRSEGTRGSFPLVITLMAREKAAPFKR